jgi:hypothetical protein
MLPQSFGGNLRELKSILRHNNCYLPGPGYLLQCPATQKIGFVQEYGTIITREPTNFSAGVCETGGRLNRCAD